jgi:hypothetical protein
MVLVLASVLWMDRVLTDVSGTGSDEAPVAVMDVEVESVSDASEPDGDESLFMTRLPGPAVALAASWPRFSFVRAPSQSPPPPPRPPSA